MIFLFLFLNSAFLISSTIEKIPFDWAGQYGLIKNNGVIFYNSDWRSNNLFFDGTWSNFPTMYGELIEEGFNDIVSVEFENEKNDSLFLNTEVLYKIGDFSLDQFSFNIEKNDGYRRYNIYGFKRSFTGFENQYFDNSLQPIQQSYITSLSSKKENTIGKIHIGHFKTFSNFPDRESYSEYRQTITTVNSQIQQNYGNFSLILSSDNFLQKLRSNHSLSITTKNRYLTRSIFEGKIKYSNSKDWNTELSLVQNKRSIKTNSIRFQDWNSVSINTAYKNLNFYINSGLINNKILLGYGLNFKKVIAGIFTESSFLVEEKPSHPYYYNSNEVEENQLIDKNIFRIFTFDYNLGKSLFHSRISLIDGSNPFWQDNEKTKTIFIKVNNQLSSNFYLSIFYNYENDITYHTGGLGDWYGIDMDYKIKIFKNNMILNFNTNIKHYNNKTSNVYFNPIEMIPMSEKLSDEIVNMTLLNFGIIMNISSVTFQYNWINLLELLNINGDSEKFNKVNFHPMMPHNGWQKQISIVWHFFN